MTLARAPALSRSLVLSPACALSQLTELKDIANPPESVKLLVEAVLLLMGFKQKEARDWSAARALMGSPSFMLQLQALGKWRARPVWARLVGRATALCGVCGWPHVPRVSLAQENTTLIRKHVHVLAPARQIATGYRRREPSGMRK